ncbi:MAG: 23S rRNA (pseudouridine(1915)-N(3))-methyltransferase RlmH [Prolixibacteraceae bacterium]|nr:23S rRNA (pseudouridine(1915)-N(3))-methyltransferase RlmH [Prolixibacteraceae bacterium]
MRITFMLVGATEKKYLREGIEDYQKRLIHYLPFEIKVIADIKNSRNLTADQLKEREGKAILDLVSTGDELVLLDVEGAGFSSPGLANWIEKRMLAGTRQLIFVVGGPYGFSEAVYKRADSKMSLSRLTFPHQLVRLLFVEQLYRAMTIIKGEPYHHG